MLILGIKTLNLKKEEDPDWGWDQLEQGQSTPEQFLINAEDQIKPRLQDYVSKNGKAYPNLSFSRNRTRVTTKKRVLASLTDEKTDHGRKDGHFEELLQKPIDETSIYYYKDRPQMPFYVSANEGRQNLVLLIGDSHALKASYRFQQIYLDAKEKNKLDEFPTIVAMIDFKVQISERYADQTMKFSLEFAKKHKPKRILLANWWVNRFCWDQPMQLSKPANCDQNLLTNYANYIVSYIKQYQNLGIQVTINNFDLRAPEMDPNHMVDFNGVIEENIKPFRLTDYMRKYEGVYDNWYRIINTTNVEIIDFKEHSCWEDLCEVLSPKGYGVFVDDNHVGKFFSRHWFTAVDHLTQFN